MTGMEIGIGIVTVLLFILFRAWWETGNHIYKPMSTEELKAEIENLRPLPAHLIRYFESNPLDWRNDIRSLNYRIVLENQKVKWDELERKNKFGGNWFDWVIVGMFSMVGASLICISIHYLWAKIFS